MKGTPHGDSDRAAEGGDVDGSIAYCRMQMIMTE